MTTITFRDYSNGTTAELTSRAGRYAQIGDMGWCQIIDGAWCGARGARIEYPETTAPRLDACAGDWYGLYCDGDLVAVYATAAAADKVIAESIHRILVAN